MGVVVSRVQVRYWAAAKAAAGVAEQALEGDTLAEVLTAAGLGRDARFAQVLSVCGLLVDGAPVGSRDHATLRLTEGAVIEVLPPFAGG